MARSLVTVVFTDIVGSTELRSSVGDDEADRIIARHDECVRRVVPDHRGSVVKYLGDGALATFSSAVDAIEAANDLQARLAGSDPSVRIGIHAGDVETSDGDISGLPVAIASRLCAVAPPGGVVVSGLVRSLAGVRGDLRFDPMGPRALKGVADPVEAWLVVAGDPVRPEPGRVPAPRLGKDVGRFVGRLESLEALDRAFKRHGRQHLVAVSGEPGIGKTALVSHWAQSAHAAGATVLVGSAPPEAVAPYQPFIEAIRPLLRFDPSVRPTGAGAANLARLMPELSTASIGPPLLDDPNTERYVINEAFVEVLASAAERHAPLVLVLDDLHWADEASIVLLGHLLRHAEDVPVLVVGTYRDTDLDRRHPLADLLRDQRRARRAERLDLSGLDATEVGSLVAWAAGGSPPDPALEVIVSETEGNPFFVEEIVEHLVAEGMVVDGAWQFDPLAPLTIPEGIRDTIGRRLDRLSEDAQQLLAAASVVGASFDVDTLISVSGASISSAERSLEEVVSAGFLTEGRSGEISFSHALVRQTILDELSILRRSRLHRAAGEALAEAGASPDRLVHHWIEGRDYVRALDASLRAMSDAEAVAAQSAVIEHARTVLDLWDAVEPPDRPPDSERHRAIVSAGLAIGISQGSLQGVEYLRSHRARLEAEGDDRGVGVVLAEEAQQLWPLGQVDEALEAAERAVELIPPQPPTPERARAEAQVGRLLMLAGTDTSRAVSLTRQALETARAVGDPHTETAALITWGVLERDVDEAEVVLRKGLEMALAQNAVFQTARARSNLSELLAGQGRYDEAIDLMSDGLETVTKLKLRGQSFDWIVANLADKYHKAGRWSEALRVLDTDLLPGYPHAIQMMIQARIAVQRGSYDEARSLLARLGDEYGHISDVQFRSPVAASHLWLVRWTGDLSCLPEGALGFGHSADERTLPVETADYLLAASEVVAWSKTRGSELVDATRFEAWVATADTVDLEPLGPAIQATIRAERGRFEGDDEPGGWERAVALWTPGTFEHAVAVLGWIGSAPDDDGAGAAARSALVAAEALGAAPLAADLRRRLER